MSQAVDNRVVSRIESFKGIEIDTTDPDEPRVASVVLAERAGMAQPRDVKKVVEKNRQELEMFGEVLARVRRTRSRNRHGEIEIEVEDFFLTEEQACCLLMHLRTPADSMVGASVRCFDS